MNRPSLPRSARVLLALFALVALTLSGCKSSVEGQTNRYNRIKDSLSAFATKNPVMKADIQAKLAEFDRDFQAASAKGGEDAISAIAQVCSRMEAYEREINPEKKAAAAAGKTPPPGSKLNQPVPSGQVAPAPAGQVAPVPAAQPTPTQPATGGKLGGAVAPAPTAAPVAPAPTAPAAAPQGGSGFGGAAPAAPAPAAPAPVAPAPTAPQGGSGFGGK